MWCKPGRTVLVAYTLGIFFLLIGANRLVASVAYTDGRKEASINLYIHAVRRARVSCWQVPLLAVIRRSPTTCFFYHERKKCESGQKPGCAFAIASSQCFRIVIITCFYDRCSFFDVTGKPLEGISCLNSMLTAPYQGVRRDHPRFIHPTTKSLQIIG